MSDQSDLCTVIHINPSEQCTIAPGFKREDALRLTQGIEARQAQLLEQFWDFGGGLRGAVTRCEIFDRDHNTVRSVIRRVEPDGRWHQVTDEGDTKVSFTTGTYS